MTFADIKRMVFARCGLGSNPANAVVSVVEDAINGRHRRVLTARGMDKLLDGTTPLTLIAGQADYSLPASVSQVNFITDPNRTGMKLDQRDLAWMRLRGDTDGDPVAWASLGLRKIHTQPTANTRLYVVSDGIDTGNVTVRFTVLGGASYVTSVALQSATAIQVGVSNTVVSVEDQTLHGFANGTVTLQTTAIGGDVLNTIPPGIASQQYQGIKLYPTPSQNATYLVDVVRAVPNMVNAYDEPMIPLDYQDILVYGAMIDVLTDKQNELDRRQFAQAEYAAIEKRLQAYVSGGYDRLIVPGAGPSGYSQLGGNYPADELV